MFQCDEKGLKKLFESLIIVSKQVSKIHVLIPLQKIMYLKFRAQKNNSFKMTQKIILSDLFLSNCNQF